MKESKHSQKADVAAVVFVVNDSQTQLTYLSGLLKNEGLDAQSFTGPETAFAAMKSGMTPDLIITDLHMPGIDGWRFCRLLRSPEYAAFNTTPILVVSATFSGEDPEEITSDLGANAFLPAPVERRIFVEHVKRLLAGETPQRVTNVLIVDNSKSVGTLVAQTFETHGYCVHTAFNSSDALQVFNEVQPEIVVLDYHLTDTNDSRLIEEFHKNKPSCAVIVITSDPKPELALQIMKLGARAYVRKPFDPKYLITLCEKSRREWSLLRAEALLEERTTELRESEKRYRQLIEQAADGIFVTNTDGRFILVNSKMCDMLGYTQTDLYSLGVLDTYPEELQDMGKHRLELLRSGKRIRFEHLIKRKDGTTFLVEESASKLSDGRLQAIIHDITERKQSEEALRQSEDRYRSILENMEESYYEVDLEGTFTFFNATAAKSLGFSEDELKGSNFRKLMDNKNATKVFNAYHDVFLTGETIPCVDWELMNKQGQKIIVEASVSLRRDAAGEPVGFSGVVRNITKRKHAEEALKQSEKRYRTIFENTGTASLLIDEDKSILLANSNFENLSGFTRKELEGMNWTVFVDKLDLDRMEKSLETRRKKAPSLSPDSYYEFQFIDRHGKTRDVFLNIAQIPGTLISVVSLMDITDRKYAEKALRESEERFRDLASLLPETVFEIDDIGRFTFVNQTALEKFGYSMEDFFKGLTVFDVLVEEDQPRAAANIQKIMQGERIGLNEYAGRRKDGRIFPALMHSTVICREGKPVGLRGFLIDITEKKNLEQQLIRAQKMEAIGTLAGGIAHDFNNLLMGILGNVSLILMQYDESHPIFDRLKSVEDYVKRGSDLSKQLLGFARGGKYEVKPTHIGEFVRKSSDMFGRTKKEIRIHHKIQDSLWTVEVDRGQMEQVLLNLFVNAWQAMPGGGELFLSAENINLNETEVSPYDLAPGRFVKVTITDTGVGMDESTKSRIFEPFFTTKERERGTGLGLASVYGIIKNHGGFILVESEKEIGTTFMIYLPASDKGVEDEEKTRHTFKQGQETILLIDDESMILEVGSEMLEALGYEVMRASSGQSGLQTYEKNIDNIDLVILDMIMPDFSGKETFDKLLRINPKVKVLLSSGYSLDGPAKEIMQRGCKGFIQKPFTMEHLSKKIRRILEE